MHDTSDLSEIVETMPQQARKLRQTVRQPFIALVMFAVCIQSIFQSIFQSIVQSMVQSRVQSMVQSRVQSIVQSPAYAPTLYTWCPSRDHYTLDVRGRPAEIMHGIILEYWYLDDGLVV